MSCLSSYIDAENNHTACVLMENIFRQYQHHFSKKNLPCNVSMTNILNYFVFFCKKRIHFVLRPTQSNGLGRASLGTSFIQRQFNCLGHLVQWTQRSNFIFNFTKICYEIKSYPRFKLTVYPFFKEHFL